MTYEEALGILRSEEADRRRRTRAVRQCAAIVVALTVLSTAWLVARGKFHFDDVLISGVPLVALVGIGYGFSTKQKSALLAAAQAGDARLVGHLCEALASGDAELAATAREALRTILPQLRPGAARLDGVQHAALATALRGSDEALALAGIAALPAIGRPESVALLESLASAPSGMRREAAASALPKMRTELARDAVVREVEEADRGRREIEARLARTGGTAGGTPEPHDARRAPSGIER